MSLSDKETIDLIRKYKEGKSNNNGISYRNKILESYSPTIKSIAGKINKKILFNNKYEDLVNEGFLGLIEAIEKFNFERGEYFSAHTNHRIKGKMLDYLRENDWVPVLTRKRLAKLNNAYPLCKNPLNFSKKELSKKLNIGEKEAELIQKSYDQFSQIKPISTLDSIEGHRDSLENYKNNKVPMPDLNPQRKDFFNFLLKGVTSPAKKIIQLYYLENLTQKEIGNVIGITEGRISQLHAQTIQPLKSKLKDRGYTLKSALSSL